MPDKGGQPPEDAADPPAIPESLPALPKAADELARQELPPVPVYGLFNDAHTQRLHEAAVQERETHAKQAEENRKLRKRNRESRLFGCRNPGRDSGFRFLIYGFWNHWHIPGSTMIAWLSSTVVQVIAVALVVTNSLFPSEKPPSEKPSQ